MASPVAVITNPADPSNHLLFFLNGSTQQLAMEVRSVDGSTPITPFVNNGPSTGSIQVNPLAAVLKKNVPTVYGTSQPQGKSGPTYVSTVSPYYNPISQDKGAQTTTPGLAACSNGDANDWVYYLRQPDGQVGYQVTEFLVDGINTTPMSSWTSAVASSNSNLAAVYFKASQERFVIYSNTEKETRQKGLYWVNSNDATGYPIRTTSGLQPGTPLALTSMEDKDSLSPYLNIYLYYMDNNMQLNRVVGRARDSSITWFQSNVVSGAPMMKESTDISATSKESTNFVYYIKDGGTTFERFQETVQPGWFKSPPALEEEEMVQRPAPDHDMGS